MARRKESAGKGRKGQSGNRVKYAARKRAASGEEATIKKEAASLESWKPKTQLGTNVKNKELLEIDEILNHGQKILEPEIVDSLLHLEQDLLLIGQSKGKFGGGARRVFRQTQKKTKEGNKPKFSALVVVGDKNGHVGLGAGKAKETVPAREKAIRQAKLNVFKIRRGCGSWQCNCGKPHSIPFTVTGKCGSVEIKFIPAPKGKGLCCEKEIAKVLELAGIKDVWTKTRGQTRNLLNFVYACEDALRKLTIIKIKPEDIRKLGIVDGSTPSEKVTEVNGESKELEATEPLGQELGQAVLPPESPNDNDNASAQNAD
jgi:small subunit ribosomal protein S5